MINEVREVRDRINEIVELSKTEDRSIVDSFILMLLFFLLGLWIGYLLGKG